MKSLFTTIIAFAFIVSMITGQTLNSNTTSRAKSGSQEVKGKSTAWHARHANPQKHLERVQQLNAMHLGADAAPNSKHRLDSVVSINDSKDVYIYDNNDRLIEELHYFYEFSLNQWVPDFRLAYSYNANHSLANEISYEWDDIMNQWIQWEKTEYIYGSNNMLSEAISSYWDSFLNNWALSNKAVYTYTVSGDINTIMHYYHTGQWELDGKDEYFYTLSGQLAHTIYSYYDSFSMTWQQASKREYTYNINGSLDAIKEFYYDYMSGTWVPSYKTEYTYDTMGNVLAELVYDYDLQTSSWVLNMKFEMVYNLGVPVSDLIVPFWYTYNYMVTSAVYSAWYNNQWIPIWNFSLYYSLQVSTPGADAVSKGVSVYPQPAADYFTIELPGYWSTAVLYLYDIQGQMLMSRAVSKQERISLEGLPPALYLYRVQQGELIYQGKLMKK